MQQFTIRKDGFREVRKKMIAAMISTFVVIILIDLYLVATAKDKSENSLVFSMTLFTIISCFTTYYSIKRLKKMYESFRLTITEDALTAYIYV